MEIIVNCEEEELLPFYASVGAAGADVKANIERSLILSPGETLMIPTGLRLEIPLGYEVQVRPRSGLAAKYGITVLNTPGTIDSDYRGEIKVLLINLGKKDFIIERGMRIAQLVIAPVVQASFIRSDSLLATARGEGGFGHTGV